MHNFNIIAASLLLSLTACAELVDEPLVDLAPGDDTRSLDDGTGGDFGTSTGGVDAGTGGVDAGTGGSEASTGGFGTSTGGVDAGTGGDEAGTGGDEAGTGGDEAGTGGDDAGTGGGDSTEDPPVAADCNPGTTITMNSTCGAEVGKVYVISGKHYENTNAGGTWCNNDCSPGSLQSWCSNEGHTWEARTDCD